MEQEEETYSYEDWRDKAIMAFKKVPKAAVAFDYVRLPKELRVKMLSDEYFVKETKQILSSQYVQDLERLNDVLDGKYGVDTKDSSSTVLKAISMKQEILYKSLGVEADESNALNIVFVSMSADEIKALPTVTVHEQESNANVSKTLGESAEEASGDN